MDKNPLTVRFLLDFLSGQDASRHLKVRVFRCIPVRPPIRVNGVLVFSPYTGPVSNFPPAR